MSEFECINHHLMPSSWGNRCRICGGRLAYMDGISNSELLKREKYEACKHELKEEEDDGDSDDTE